jgi:lipopolysaccharide/colanic/teichoic acid biosynthesis glycosyltransferase
MSKIDGHQTTSRLGQNRVGQPGPYPRHFKRALDLALVLLAAPVALPLIALAWALVRLDGGPGFFGHVRIGRDGRAFTCWKIRTMHRDAPARLAALLRADPSTAHAWNSHGKLASDPRITPLGRILRRLSIDELPQVWNVLRGEMSIVGPRPITLPELDRYGTRQRYYVSCRPGITGLWQVSGRNRLSYDDRVALDQAYAERITLFSDLSVILRTIPTVLGLTGL